MRRAALIVALAFLTWSPTSDAGNAVNNPPSTGGGSSGVSSLNGQTGVVTATAAQGLSVTSGGGSLAFGQVIQATWPIANVRWYCIDGTNGNDSNVGFSDTSSADCGTKAVKTMPALAAIIPSACNDRKLVIRPASFDYTGQGGLDTVLGSTYGCAPTFPLVLPTVTNSTSGAVAFANTVADKIQAGFVTVPGMNAAGYNPVSPFSQSTIKSLTVAAGTPGFPAEPAEPMGWRVRFDAATTTTALRNWTSPIIAIPASDTLGIPNPATGAGGLPALPVGTDIYYIEKAGVTVDQTLLGSLHNNNSNALRPGVMQFVGINFSGLSVFSGGRYLMAGCSAASSGISFFSRIDTPFFYTDETNVSRQVGSGLRAAGFAQGTGNPFALNGLGANQPVVSVGTLTMFESSRFNISDGSYCGAGVALFNCHAETSVNSSTDQAASVIGGRVANSQSPVRIVGAASGPAKSAGLMIISSDIELGRLLITSAGTNPAIALTGKCYIYADSVVTGSTGNTDVGLDLTTAANSTIFLGGTPTVTGTTGDVRLCDGTVVTWASIFATPLTDACGNQFISSNGNGLASSVANGTNAFSTGSVAPAGCSATTPKRWMKVPDTVGGFFLVPSCNVTEPWTFDPFLASPLLDPALTPQWSN